MAHKKRHSADIGKTANRRIFSKTDAMSTLPATEATMTHISNSNELDLKPNARNIMDGMDLLASIESGTVATAFFDPQYRGVLDKLSYGNEGKRQKGRASLAQMDETTIKAFIAGIAGTLHPSGHLFLWIDKFHLCEGIAPWIKDTDLAIVDLVVWDKGRIGMGYRTRRKSEYLQVLQKAPTKAKAVWTRHDIPDVWQEKVGRDHPHAKPVDLQSRLIEATTRPGDIVIDPAAGGFSVLESCRRIGNRTFYGSDIADHGGWQTT